MSLSRGGRGKRGGRRRVTKGFRARMTPKRCLDRLRWSDGSSGWQRAIFAHAVIPSEPKRIPGYRCVRNRKPGKSAGGGLGVSGRHALYRAARGWDVTGFDIAGVAMAPARMRAKNFGGLRLAAQKRNGQSAGCDGCERKGARRPGGAAVKWGVRSLCADRAGFALRNKRSNPSRGGSWNCLLPGSCGTTASLC